MALIDDTYALIAPNLRNIGGIIPDLTIEEHHFDRLIITEHPVETGAAITDHSFRNPSEVVMKIGFSNSTAKTEGWVQEAYEMLLELQRARQPFDVYTGKRPYTNMLVDLIDVSTDPSTEYALNVTVPLREIIIVSTQQGSAPTDQQAMPDQTAPVQQSGTEQLGVSNGVPSFAQTSAIQSGAGTAGSGFDTIANGQSFAPTTGGFYPGYSSVADNASTSTGDVTQSPDLTVTR